MTQEPRLRKLTARKREDIAHQLDRLKTTHDEAIRAGNQNAAKAALDEQFALLQFAAYDSTSVH